LRRKRNEGRTCRYESGSLENTRKECEDKGAEARGYELNVSQEAEVEAVYSQVVSDFGTLDATINNAGILRDGLLVKVKEGKVQKFSMSKWQAVIDTNLTGVFLCAREAAAHFVEQKKPGVIINIASVARSGNFGQSNYSAAKAGVSAMTVLWAQELAQHGIRVPQLLRDSLLQRWLFLSVKKSRKTLKKVFLFVVLRNRAKCRMVRFSSSKMITTLDVYWKSTVESGFESFVQCVAKRTALRCDCTDLGFKLVGN